MISSIEADSITRLKKIEDQIRGLQRMIDEKKYCIDILFQISAVPGGLKKVGHNILKNHIQTCMADVMASPEQEDKDKKIKELIDVFERFMDYK